MTKCGRAMGGRWRGEWGMGGEFEKQVGGLGDNSGGVGCGRRAVGGRGSLNERSGARRRGGVHESGAARRRGVRNRAGPLVMTRNLGLAGWPCERSM